MESTKRRWLHLHNSEATWRRLERDKDTNGDDDIGCKIRTVLLFEDHSCSIEDMRRRQRISVGINDSHMRGQISNETDGQIMLLQPAEMLELNGW